MHDDGFTGSGKAGRSLDQDVWAGGVFAVIAALFLLGSFAMPFGTFGNMGPGYFPALVSIGLLLLGATIAVNGLRGPARPVAGVQARGMLFLGAAPFVFLLVVTPFGLAPAVFGASLCSTLADRSARLRSAIVISLGVTAGAVVIFKYLLGAIDPVFRMPVPGA